MSMDPINTSNEVLRDYLLRAISDNNLVFNNFFNSSGKSNRDVYNKSFTKILKGFMSGNELTMDRIFKDIKCNHVGYKVYQYFDINTLYAYLKYQDKILELIRKDAGESSRITSKNIEFGIIAAKEWLFDHRTPLEDKGFFDKKIHSVKQKFGNDIVYYPKKPLTSPEFRDKYNGVDFKSILNDYIVNNLYPKVKLTSESTGPNERTDYIEYVYNGEVLRLKVEEKKTYMTKHLAPVTLYKARGEQGYLEIAIAYDGSIYIGPIYDVGRVLVEDVYGDEKFYPNTKYFGTGKGKSSKVAEVANTEKTFEGKPISTYTDDDQISLI